jgi:hypothetical protein
MDAWIYCFTHNTPSIRGIEKGGFRLLYRFTRTRVLGWFDSNKVVPFTDGPVNSTG